MIKQLLSLALVLTTSFLSGTELVVLGIAQDAGYPQAGCYKPHCMPGWEDKNKRLGATSIAVINPEAKSTLVFEATPDMPDQLYQLEQAAPGYSLDGVFLTHAHIGHYTGLMYFGHEAMGAKNVPVFAMPRMSSYLQTNGPWSQLVNYKNINLKLLKADQAVMVKGVEITPVIVPHRDEYSETVGYYIKGPERTALFIPDINKWQLWKRDLATEVAKVDYALIDATFYADGEIPGRAMEDIPHPFVVESMALFKDASVKEKAKVHFIHFNHTNPLLSPSSDASEFVLSKGFKIARPGMRLPL